MGRSIILCLHDCGFLLFPSLSPFLFFLLVNIVSPNIERVTAHTSYLLLKTSFVRETDRRSGRKKCAIIKVLRCIIALRQWCGCLDSSTRYNNFRLYSMHPYQFYHILPILIFLLLLFFTLYYTNRIKNDVFLQFI